jgi:FtsZ-binding cell division protein ZapB
MSNQSAAANAHPFVREIPAPQPPDPADPLPALRREITLLRIELEQLRARENEARQAKEFLLARIDRIMENRDLWQREAERLKSLIPQVPCSADDETLNKPPHWSLFGGPRLPR